MPNIADQIVEGQRIAQKLGQYPHAAHHEMATLNQGQMASLEAWRAHEMSRLVALVENSTDGEKIRFAAARAVYRATLAQNLHITPEAIAKEETR